MEAENAREKKEIRWQLKSMFFSKKIINKFNLFVTAKGRNERMLAVGATTASKSLLLKTFYTALVISLSNQI